LRGDRPRNINHYIGRGGYSGLVRALKMAPEEVIEEVGRSGLRERGGDGFPAGKKWRLSFDAPGSEKVVICNAAEATQILSHPGPCWKETPIAS